jgi:hypothetical protein
MDLAWLDLPYDQRKKVVLKDTTGVVVGMVAYQEPIGTPDGPLVDLQRQLDEDMRGNCNYSPWVDRDRAERALERLRAAAGAGGRLFVSWATAEEIRAFESSRPRVN